MSNTTISTTTTPAGVIFTAADSAVEVYAEHGRVYLLNLNIETDEAPLAGRIAEIRARLQAALDLLDDPRVRMLAGEA